MKSKPPPSSLSRVLWVCPPPVPLCKALMGPLPRTLLYPSALWEYPPARPRPWQRTLRPWPCLSSQDREAASGPCGGDQYAVQCPPARHHLHPCTACFRQWGPVCPAARGHHLCLPGDLGSPIWPTSCPALSCMRGPRGPDRPPLACSNTRSCSPAGSGPASSSAMAQASARGARWPASSWRITCGAGRSPCGECAPPTPMPPPHAGGQGGEGAPWHPPARTRRFSVSNDLKYDAERDLRDIDALGIAVHALSKVGGVTPSSGGVPEHRPGRAPTPAPLPQIKYGDNTTSEGVLFATYSALIGESQAGGQHRTRIRQILEWCGEAFDGVVSWLCWGGGGGGAGGMGSGGGGGRRERGAGGGVGSGGGSWRWV